MSCTVMDCHLRHRLSETAQYNTTTSRIINSFDYCTELGVKAASDSSQGLQVNCVYATDILH